MSFNLVKASLEDLGPELSGVGHTLTSPQRLVLATVASHVNSKEPHLGMWESVATLGEETQLGARQVRRHLKHISHPIIGDSNYGKGEHNRLHRRRFNLKRLALHCWLLALRHPVHGHPMRFVSPLPLDLAEPLRRMGMPRETLGFLRLDGSPDHA